ncbi:MAG: DUF5719 family protein [Bifidobacteriaceae bacterium]|jgi:hypothetical protein|nr:DUF5719 family protein [Bifidobacteriaceae bacterium]
MRLLRRVLAIVVAVALVAGLGGFYWLERTYPARTFRALAPEVIEVAAGESVAVCPSELKLSAEQSGDVSYDPRFDPRPSSVAAATIAVATGEAASVTGLYGPTPGEDLAGGGMADALNQGLQLSEGATATELEVTDEPWVVQAATGQEATSLATGGTAILTADGDLRGLAAGGCVAPAVESWLVGGSTELGSSARLVLVNPGVSNVTADVALWDGAGPVAAVGLTGLVVPGGSGRAILLEGIDADAARLAVHVVAAGGELAVYLQHSRLNGLTPAGVDLAVPGAAPATTVTVAGLDVTASSFDAARASALRVFNPSAEPAEVTVALWGPDGTVSLPGLDAATVGAGQVSDLSLAGLAEGSYVAQVSSSQPVVVAGLSLRQGPAPATEAVGQYAVEDFGWAAGGAVSGDVYLAWPQLGANQVTGKLVLGAAVDLQVTVSLVGARITLGELAVDLPAGQSVVVDPEALAGELWTVSSDQPLAVEIKVPAGARIGAALVLLGDPDAADGQTIAVLTPTGQAAGRSQIAVRPAR